MIDKNGVFVGLISVAIGNEKNTKKIIAKIFSDYRERLSKFGNFDKEQEKHLFVPKFYSIFGSYDLAVISKVDDFVFGYQKFNPNLNYSTDSEQAGRKSFKYHVYNCTVSSDPRINESGYDKLFDVEDEAEEKKNEPAFCSVTSFKIKSSLLIGAGVAVIDAVKVAIAKHLKEHNKNDNQNPVNYLITDTTSWHEITLILTGNCLVTLGNVVYRIRELISLEHDVNPALDGNPRLLDSSLLAKWSKDRRCPPTTNVFTTSNTYFGVQFERLSEENPVAFDLWIEKYLNRQEDLGAYSRIATIPTTHHRSSDRKIGRFDAGYILYNDADIEPGDYNEKENQNGLVKMLSYYRQIILKENPEAESSIRSTHTTPKIKFDKSILGPKSETVSLNNRGNISDLLDALLPIKFEEIDAMELDLAALNVSKAVRQRFVKALSNFNDIINDRLLYIYIVDMRPFILGMKGYLKLEVEWQKNNLVKDAHHLMDKINGFARLLEHVYYNIIQHSLRSMDLSEFNLDFNGGIQQNLSVSSFIFGLFRKAINFYEKDEREYLFKYFADGGQIVKRPLIFHATCAAYLSNTSGIRSYEYSLQLNYFHITEPATFLVTIFKEAFNRLFERTTHETSWRLNRPDSEGRKITAKEICRRILAWDENKLREDTVHFETIEKKDEERNSGGKKLKGKKKINMRFDVLYSLFADYPKTASLRLQQEVLAAIQKTTLQSDIDKLLKVYKFVEFIDEELIQYIIVDYNNYKYYFGSDDSTFGGFPNLYKTWYWVHFFQEPDVYKTNGEISTKMLLKALYRITMLYILVEFDREKRNYETLWTEGLGSEWYKHLRLHKSDLLDVYYDSTFEICRLMHENSFLCGFLNMRDIKVYSMNLHPKLMYEEDPADIARYRETCSTLFKNILGKGSDPEGNFAELLKFRNYNAGRKTAVEARSTFILWGYLRATFLCYLQELAAHIDVPINRCQKDDDEQNEELIGKKGWPDPRSVSPSKIQPDPNGGFFVTGNLKQNYFLANNYLFKILYNYTLVCKIEYFEGLQQ